MHAIFSCFFLKWCNRRHRSFSGNLLHQHHVAQRGSQQDELPVLIRPNGSLQAQRPSHCLAKRNHNKHEGYKFVVGSNQSNICIALRQLAIEGG